MATSSSYFCSLCQEDDENSSAVTWCAECEVFLCSGCQIHHGRSKTSKHHQVMSVQNYQNLPEFLLKIKNHCEDHDLRYELFCSFHDAACCVKCIKDNHDNCKGLVPLKEVVGNIKSSACMSQVEKDLVGLFENLKTIKNFLSENLETLQKQKAESIDTVHNMRQSINEHLDKLQKCLLKDIESEFTKARDIIEGLKNEIVDKTDRIEQKQIEFSKMVEFSTDLQAYFGVHEMEKITMAEKKYIDNLKSANNLREKMMTVDKSFDLDSTTLGSVAISLSPDNLQLLPTGDEQVQSPQNPDLAFDKIKPAVNLLRLTMPDESVRVTGCQILPNGDVLFVDQQNQSLLLINQAGELVREVMNFTKPPSDICYVRQNEVAVTLSRDREMLMVDVEKNKIVKHTDIDGECHGICTYDQTLYVIAVPSTIIALDYDFNVKSRTQVFQTNLTRIAVFGRKIYCTDFINNTVFCYSKAGEVLWSYYLDIIGPYGIDVDIHGFVYVACASQVIALSQDGTKSKAIVFENSHAININREMSLLLISSLKGNSFLLSIQE